MLKTLQWIAVIVLASGVCAAQAQPRRAPASDEFPNSIMVPEPGTRGRAAPKAAPMSAPKPAPQRSAEPDETAAKLRPEPGRRRIGSSSPSPLPPPRSVVTPVDPPARVIEQPPLPKIPAYPTPVPGYATVPAPPTSLSGQTFQDKAIGCAHYGTGAGVGPGQIGGYTGSCVNSR